MGYWEDPNPFSRELLLEMNSVEKISPESRKPIGIIE